jgi:methionyl-tRNA formyltransferase
MRVVFLGSLGAYSAQHLDAIAATQRVVGVICALERGGRARGIVGRMLRRAGLLPDRCGSIARKHGIPRWFADRSGERVAELVSALNPDVICIAGYPWLLPPSVWRQPALGALNCHASLLPRHRGVLPLFWVYYHGDERTGVTVHRVNERADAGEIICQDAYALPRGLPVDRLNALNAERGSRALCEALASLGAGQRRGFVQDEANATGAPRVLAGTPMVDWKWDVERVWHFLAGLYPRFIEPLRDEEGHAGAYRSVLGYQRRPHRGTVGTLHRTEVGWQLYCDGGVVELGRNERPNRRVHDRQTEVEA